MAYTLKIQDQSISWCVTFRGTNIISINGGQQFYTPDSPQWKHAKRYVEDLMIEQIKL